MKTGRSQPRVPTSRIRDLNELPPRREGRYVLYWMTANRRRRRNFALQHAVDLAREQGRPLLILEALRVDHPHACRRFHRFVMDGMIDNRRDLEGPGLHYYPYVEREPGAGRGLLAALAEDATLVVADDWPAFFLPKALRAAAEQVGCRMQAVDSVGVLPFRAAGRDFATAALFRRWLQKQLPQALEEAPLPDPLTAPAWAESALPRRGLPKRFRPATVEELGSRAFLQGLPIDATVGEVERIRGGAVAARQALERFLDQGLPRYLEERNDPGAEATSGLSPWLHFGHLATHEVLAALLGREGWSMQKIAPKPTGKREGFWGASPAAEAFIDQLVTWRELGFASAAALPDPQAYESLPGWARATLENHAGDRRETVYSFADLDNGRTHDEVWNAAQNQLRVEGRIPNYLRMLWGKKIIEWSPSPRAALEILFRLNDRYALDGRDPNSTSGILWCLGRYDRPFFPERPVFGTVRWMSTANTRRKLDLDDWLDRHGSASERLPYADP